MISITENSVYNTEDTQLSSGSCLWFRQVFYFNFFQGICLLMFCIFFQIGTCLNEKQVLILGATGVHICTSIHVCFVCVASLESVNINYIHVLTSRSASKI